MTPSTRRASLILVVALNAACRHGEVTLQVCPTGKNRLSPPTHCDCSSDTDLLPTREKIVQGRVQSRNPHREGTLMWLHSGDGSRPVCTIEATVQSRCSQTSFVLTEVALWSLCRRALPSERPRPRAVMTSSCYCPRREMWPTHPPPSAL